MDEIVGRDVELAAIEAWFDEPTPSVLMLEGEPGIGKSTLWRAGVREARERGYEVLSSFASRSEAELSFAALRDLIDEVFGDVAGQLAAPQRHALAVVLRREEPDPDRGFPDPATIGIAFRSALLALATRGPTMVAIDDVQWLDRSSADVLAYTARRLGDAPVALLLTQRTGEITSVPLELDRVFGERLGRVRLRPLSLGATHRLLRSHFGLTLSRPEIHRLHTACGGNPLFALELGRTLEDTPVSADEPLPVPHDVGQLVRRRIKRLSRPGRAAVLAAALQGEPTAAVVQQAASEAGLEEAVAADILVTERDTLRFAHPLFAEAATSLTLESRRREMHMRLASLLAEPETRAQHLALGTSEPDEEVASTLDRAAEIAHRRGALVSAAALAEHAARLTPAVDPDAAARRTTGAAWRWLHAGDTQRSLALLEPLLAELPGGTLRLEARYAQLGSVMDRHVRRRLLEDVVAEAEGHPMHQMRFLISLCGELYTAREFDSARERAQAAVALAERMGDPSQVALALSMLGRLDVGVGGLEALHRAHAFESGGSAFNAYEVVFDAVDSPATWIGWWLLANDELDAARRMLVEQHRKWVDAGNPWEQAWIDFPLAELECRAGNYDAARAYAEDGAALAEQLDSPLHLSRQLYCRALVAAHVGDVATARASADESLAIAEAIHNKLAVVRPKIALAFLATAEKNYAEALEHLEGLTEVALEGPYWATYPFWGDLFEALVAVGELERAHALLADIDTRKLRVQRPGMAPMLARCRGLVLAASGEVDDGIESLEEALRLQSAQSVPFERARTLLVLGVLQRRERRRRAARETLQRALAIFEELGAELWAARARDELGRIGGRAPSTGALTPTEHRLADLVVSGKSNKEVAAELVISVHTVESTLTSVYRKLDVRSRTELAHKLAKTTASES